MIKTKAQEMIEELSTQFALESDLTSDGIKKALEKRLKLFDIDGVQVDDVDIDMEGDIVVTFSDYEGDTLEAIFLVDDEEIQKYKRRFLTSWFDTRPLSKFL